MGSEKRDRQREARLEKLEAEASAARRARAKRRGIRLAAAAVVIGGGLFAYSLIAGGDDEDDGDAAADDEAPAAMSSAECSIQAPPPTEWSEPTLAEEVLAREAPDPAPPPAETPADALETETVTEGEGEAAAAAGDCVYVHYVGKVPDGTVFDESWTREQPFPLLLGQGMVIPGWDQGLVDAQIGERRRLVIGPDNAYGPEGSPPAIPPNSPLAFEVDVVDIVPTELSEGAAAPGAAPPADPTATAPADPTATVPADPTATVPAGETTTSAPAS